MRWYELVRFRCPRCGQRLAVERGQALRGERVTCQDCNVLIELRLGAGQAPPPPAAPPEAGSAPAAVVVDLSR